MNTEIKECEGSCEERGGHIGEIVRVIVSSNTWKPMEFNYCQAAIEEDKKRGFTVEIIQEKQA
jgi:hypothetical protein